jgi:Uma2 family endonuclease
MSRGAGRRSVAIRERWMTLEEFLKLPEESPALELIDGMVTQKVPPQWVHGGFQYRITERINRFAEPRKLAFAFPELREAFGRDSLVPDVAVYRWERIPRSAAGRLVNAAPMPPDIAIEIRSPGQRVQDLVDKCRRYLAHGSELTLVVDPDGESVILTRPGAEPATLRGQDRIDLDPVLPGFELTVEELFSTLQFD